MTAVKMSQDPHWIHWAMKSAEPITAEDAKAAQQKAGYLVMGYGFEGFTAWVDADGIYHAHWKCYSSCD